MSLKIDAKSEEELTCCCKIDMWNLTNFDPSTQNFLKMFALMSSFCAKYRGAIFHDTED